MITPEELQNLPWKVEDGVINVPNTFVIHCPYGPLALLIPAPGGNLLSLEEVATVLQKALDLRAENERLREACLAAFELEDATYLVKKYPSNSRYQRKLKRLHDQIKAAWQLVETRTAKAE